MHADPVVFEFEHPLLTMLEPHDEFEPELDERCFFTMLASASSS